MYFEAELKGKHFKVDVVEGKSSWKISLQQEGKPWHHFELNKQDYKKSESYFSFLFRGVSYLVDVIGQDTQYTVFTRNSFKAVKIYNDEMILHTSLKRGGGLGPDADLRSGMPGKIIEIYVKPGDVVKEDQPLLIMEAMKMENEMRAAGDIKIKEVCVKQGDSVESGSILIKFEPID
jgi:biotin carboxyl carrier protein